MVKNTKTKIKAEILIINILLLFVGCANQLPPGGGEVDKVPPKIVESYPKNGTINFNDNNINFDFSEYVDKRTFKEAVFISPQINGELEYNWSGTNVTIEFPKKLKPNTTYVVTIGTDVADLHNRNRMAKSFSLSFSTGNEIDKRKVSGRVYANNSSGIMIYVYKLESDSLNPELQKPDYLTQTGKDGIYELDGLAKGKFRVFAVRDKFKDFLFQPKQDEIGIAGNDLYFISNDTSVSNFNFKLTNKDKTPPNISTAVMTDESHILLTFSKNILSEKLSKNNFQVFDSLEKEYLNPDYTFLKYPSKSKVVLVFNNFTTEKNNFYLWTKNIRGEKGNISLKDSINVIYSNRTDTSKPTLLKIIPNNNSKKADFKNQIFRFYFSDVIDSITVKKGVTFIDRNNNNIPFRTDFIDDASFSISPLKDLRPLNKYKIILDLSKIKNKNGAITDSNYVYNFTTINGLNFTGLKGKVKNIKTTKNIFVILNGSGKNKKRYVQKIGKDYKFEFKRIVAGKYELWSFIDFDGNGKYSYGEVSPYKIAERFKYYPKIIELKPRWVETDLVLNFAEEKK